MTTNEILILAQAGFNAQQISALSKIQQNTDNGNMVVGTQANQMPGQMTQTTQQSTQLDDIARQINELTSNMQLANMQLMQQPKQETTDDILASIINPSQNGGK